MRVAHWANAVFLAGMMASGLQIYGAWPHFGSLETRLALPNPWDAHALPPWMRLGGWLAGGINWHFALAWPFVLTGLVYAGFLAASGEWRALVPGPRDVPRAGQMLLYYLRLRRAHPPQEKLNALQKWAYTLIVLLGALATLTGLALWKPVQLAWLPALFGGYERTRYWHFGAVWLFLAFLVVHVVMVFVADPASLPAMVTGRYRVRRRADETR